MDENKKEEQPPPQDIEEKRSATELIIGLGAPAILAGGHVIGKILDRPRKEEPPRVILPSDPKEQ